MVTFTVEILNWKLHFLCSVGWRWKNADIMSYLLAWLGFFCSKEMSRNPKKLMNIVNIEEGNICSERLEEFQWKNSNGIFRENVTYDNIKKWLHFLLRTYIFCKTTGEGQIDTPHPSSWITVPIRFGSFSLRTSILQMKK